jgi:hypothetical protein
VAITTKKGHKKNPPVWRFQEGFFNWQEIFLNFIFGFEKSMILILF